MRGWGGGGKSFHFVIFDRRGGGGFCQFWQWQFNSQNFVKVFDQRLVMVLWNTGFDCSLQISTNDKKSC